MKKILLSIFAVMLAVFSVQAEEVTFTAAGAGNVGTSGSGSEVVLENGAVKVVLSKAFGNGTQFRIYQNCTLTISATDATITNVSFEAYDGKTGAIALNEGGGSITSSGTTRSWAGSSNTVVLKANAQIRTQSITIKYTTAGETPDVPVLETLATPDISPASCEFNLGESVNVTISAVEGAKIYYTLDGTTPTESSAVYSSALSIEETTTVKAIAVKDGYNNSEVAEAKFTAVDPNAKEVEAAISFASTAQRLSQDGNSQMWSNGGITFKNNKSASQNAVVGNTNPVRLYANSELVIECAGNITKIVFDCNNTSYATALKNSIGDAATVSSDIVTLTLDGTSSIYTVAKLTAQVRMDALTVTYLVSASQEEKPAAPTFSVETGSKFYPTLEFEISAAEGAVIYYTLNGENPTTESAVYSTPITIEETTVVKAIAVIDGVESDVAAASYKKVIDSVTGNVADAFYYYVVGEQIPAVITGYIVGAVNGTSFGDGGENCKFDVTEIENATNILIADNADETDYTKCLVVQLPSGDVRNALNLVDNPGNLKKKVVLTATLETYFGVAGLKDIVVGELVEESWSSFYAAFPVAIPEGVEAYIVTAANAGYVTLTQIYNAVPANTGVILKGGSIEATNDNYYSGAVAEVTGNLLQGTMTNTYISEEAYVLGKVDGVIGLYKALMTDGEWLNNANKAYLPASAVPESAQGAASFSFRFPGTTAIENVEVENEVKVIYDLTGRKVETISAPGIYIVNGKKVLVK